MTIAADILELQAINVSVTGITSAPTSYPAALNTADLPCVICWPGPATWSRPSLGDLQRMDRTYLIRVYVEALGQNQWDTAIQDCITLLDAFGRKYIDKAADSTVSLHIQAREGGVRDNGVQVLTYAGTDFHGFEFQVDVHTKVSS